VERDGIKSGRGVAFFLRDTSDRLLPTVIAAMQGQQAKRPRDNRMDDRALKTYLDGWSRICNSTPETLGWMLEGAHPDMRFSDVNSPNVHTGHDGVRRLNELATGKYPDAAITTRDLLFDGTNWSIRWTMTGTRPDGSSFNRKGASAGSVADDGRVIEHTDYWSQGDAAG
jgi:hypothetical protein